MPISGFLKQFKTLDGNSRPILLQVKGIDGRTYSQILKGRNDDLRQDAVMQQLFKLT